MSIYLSHTSARATWGLIGVKGLTADTICNVRRPLDADTTIRQIKAIGHFDSGFLSRLQKPIDLLVPSKGARIRSIQVCPHLCLRNLPPGSFRQLRENVYVVSPAINYVQMGEVLSVSQLLAYGIELCGNYALAPNTDRGFVDRPPLASLDDLLEASRPGSRIRGAKTAREALTWVKPGSRSPRETLCYVLLILPEEMGGYGLPAPTLNEAVELSPEAARIVGTSVIHPDLCWRAFKVIVEYDSDATHLEEGQVIRDVDRKDAFVRDGWYVVTITKDRLNKPEKLDRLVREDIAPRLGVAVPELTREFIEARKSLRGELFGFDPYVPTVKRDRGRLPESKN